MTAPFAAWFLRQLCEYLGLRQRGCFLRRSRPTGPLIQSSEERTDRFVARGTTIAWGRELVAILMLEDDARQRYAPVRRRLERVLQDVMCFRWARYGAVNGDQSNSVLDEPHRVAGSAINSEWANIMQETTHAFTPNREYVRVCCLISHQVTTRTRTIRLFGRKRKRTYDDDRE